MSRTRLTPNGILEQAEAEPSELVPADVMLGLLGHDHPLYLPMDLEGTALHDFSALDLRLAELAKADAAPVCPVDLAPLVKLCRRHRKQIQTWELWSYKLYYFELMAMAGKLVPLFWGNVEVLKPALFPDEVLTLYGDGVLRLPEERRVACQEIWAELASEWIRRKVIVPHDDRPWLSWLRYFPQDFSGARWDDPEFPFSDCIGFVMQPFYRLRGSLQWLRHQMTLELWKTSIFHPHPLTPQSRKAWRNHEKRFLLRHQFQAEQVKRKQKLVRRLKELMAEGVPRRGMVERVRAEGLWPYSVWPRRRTRDYDADANCLRVVNRLCTQIAAGEL
ncbi:MAG: hypothetical protein KKI08_04565 [Armatimonadetes bacterium]|nr:hypothetical protein [Armatimonadota bacterium]